MKRSSGFGRLFFAGLFLLAGTAAFAQTAQLPPDEAGAKDRLINSPRHGEWVKVDAGNGDMVDAWITYPERSDKAPVVLVVHEIFGLTDWVRSVADQLSAEGYIAIAPDLLSGKGPGGRGTSSVDPDTARTLLAGISPDEIMRRLNAAVAYATSLPAAQSRFAVMGFCWGGGVSFAYATVQPALSAAILFYGTPPQKEALARINAPVLAFYGGSDFRVSSTAAPTAAEMKRLGKSFEYGVFDGAGHAFMRAQSGQGGANLKAAQKAWPRALAFLSDAFARKATNTNDASARRSIAASFDLVAAAAPASFTCSCDDDGVSQRAPARR